MLRVYFLQQRFDRSDPRADDMLYDSEAKRLLLEAGTIVDATTIAAPSSRKHATQTRDPELKRTR